MHRFLLALTLFASSALAARAQAGCPSNPPYTFPYINSIYTTPSAVYAYTPFTLHVQACNIPANTSYQLSISLTQQTYFGISIQDQVTIDASGTVSVPYGAQFPASPYLAQINGTPLPFAGNGLFFSILAPPPGLLNKLSGEYTFLFQGATTASLPPGASTQAAIAGTFFSDGNGHITAGEADVNSPYGAMEQVPITGSYTYDATGKGTITFLSSAGAQTFALTVNPANLTTYESVYNAVFTSSQGGPFIGSGTLQVQQFTPESYPTAYTFQSLYTLTGETPCDTSCVAAGYHALPLSTSASMLFSNPLNGGQNFTYYPSSFTATYDQTFGSSAVTGLSESGTLSPPDSYGRSVLTITPPTNYGSPSRFAVYLSFGQYVITPQAILSLDPHDQAVLLSGGAL